MCARWEAVYYCSIWMAPYIHDLPRCSSRRRPIMICLLAIRSPCLQWRCCHRGAAGVTGAGFTLAATLSCAIGAGGARHPWRGSLHVGMPLDHQFHRQCGGNGGGQPLGARWIVKFNAALHDAELPSAAMVQELHAQVCSWATSATEAQTDI